MSSGLLVYIFATFLILAVSYAAGRIIFFLLKIKFDTFYAGAAPTIGLVVLALQLWVYGYVHIPWNVFTLLFPWTIIVGYGIKKRALTSKNFELEFRLVPKLKREIRSYDVFTKAILAVALVFSLAYLIMLVLQPFTTSDILAFWGYKAKEFFIHDSVYINDSISATKEIAQYYHIDYPPLWPLMADVTYTLFGNINETLFKTTQFVFLVSGAATMYAFLRTTLGKKYIPLGAAVTFSLIAAPQFLRMLFDINYMGYADYPLAIIMLVSVLFFIRGSQNPLSRDWWIAIALSSAAAVTKNEGLPFFLIIAGISLLLYIEQLLKKRKDINIKSVTKLLVTFVLIASPIAAWNIYKITRDISVDFKLSNIEASGLSIPERLHRILSLIWLYIRTNPAYQWQAAGIVLAFAAILRYRDRTTILVGMILALQLVSYVASYMISPYDLEFHILSSIDRLCAQVLPILLVLLALLVSERLRRQPATK